LILQKKELGLGLEAKKEQMKKDPCLKEGILLLNLMKKWAFQPHNIATMESFVQIKFHYA